jgi:hypothetical protein
VASTQIQGTVAGITSPENLLTIAVTAVQGSDPPFRVGETEIAASSPGTPVIFLDGHLGTVSELRPGTAITLSGLSDIRAPLILSPQAITQIAPAP